MRGLVVAASIASLLVATSGRAEDRSVEDAKRFFYSAQTHYKLGEFEQALHDFQDAYRLQQDPALLFNIGQCYKQLGRLDDALRSFRFYSRDGGAGVNHPVVDKMIAEVEAQIAARDRARAAPAAAPPVSEPKPAPSASASAPARARSEAVAINVAQPRMRSGRAELVGGAVVGAIGLGLVAGGIGVGVLASQNADALTALDRAHMPYDPALDDSRQTNFAASVALLTIGGAAVVCGTALVAVGARRRRGR